MRLHYMCPLTWARVQIKAFTLFQSLPFSEWIHLALVTLAVSRASIPCKNHKYKFLRWMKSEALKKDWFHLLAIKIRLFMHVIDCFFFFFLANYQRSVLASKPWMSPSLLTFCKVKKSSHPHRQHLAMLDECSYVFCCTFLRNKSSLQREKAFSSSSV